MQLGRFGKLADGRLGHQLISNWPISILKGQFCTF